MAICLMALPVVLPAQAPAPFAWLTGCWRMNRGATVVDERWGDMHGGMMLGTSRTVRDGRTVEYEFARITISGDTIAFHALPSGQPQASFAGISHSADSTVFSNPQHDFPKIVVYKRLSADSVHAWVGGEGRRFDFRYARVACQ